MLLIAGQVATPNLNKNRGAVHEIVNQLDTLRNVTKWQAAIMEPGQVPAFVQEAMKQATAGRPRPVALEIPVDILAARADFELAKAPAAHKPEPDAALVQRAAELLSRARQPVIWAGGGVQSRQGATGFARPGVVEARGTPRVA